jgi:gamma-glutamylcyclotransferase (GGCT)/AIG2-like uncharacterized protein YtfP
MTNHLFVYGTLRRDSSHPMARLLAERARHLGTAMVRGRLYDLDRYPGILEPASDGDWVHGDLYDLGADPTTLAELDTYELAESPLPAYFDRQCAEAVLPDGGCVQVWVYWYRGEVGEQQRIASGRYGAAGKSPLVGDTASDPHERKTARIGEPEYRITNK